jgi:hypothetical protein
LCLTTTNFMCCKVKGEEYCKLRIEHQRSIIRKWLEYNVRIFDAARCNRWGLLTAEDLEVFTLRNRGHFWRRQRFPSFTVSGTPITVPRTKSLTSHQFCRRAFLTSVLHTHWYFRRFFPFTYFLL